MHNPIARWNAMTEPIGQVGSLAESLRPLVEQLENLSLSKPIYPFVSMGTVGISSVPEYDEARQRPAVWFSIAHDGALSIAYQPCMGAQNSATGSAAGPTLSPELLSQVLSWLFSSS